MSYVLKLVLTDHWFEEIKAGRKKHEYRKASKFWEKRIYHIRCHFSLIQTGYWDELKKDKYFVEFQKAYRKNPERMLFEIKHVDIINGTNTDLKYDGLVFDIELGERIK